MVSLVLYKNKLHWINKFVEIQEHWFAKNKTFFTVYPWASETDIQ